MALEISSSVINDFNVFNISEESCSDEYSFSINELG